MIFSNVTKHTQIKFGEVKLYALYLLLFPLYDYNKGYGLASISA
jgi:hypothetical protein